MKRLRDLVQLLRQDESIEADSPQFPGLAALCHALTNFVDHRDKEVRLYTVSACMELFTIVSCQDGTIAFSARESSSST